MTTTERLRQAAETCRAEAAELARHPAPDLYPELAAEAARLAATAHPSWHDTVVSPHMVALADAILGTPAGVFGE